MAQEIALADCGVLWLVICFYIIYTIECKAIHTLLLFLSLKPGAPFFSPCFASPEMRWFCFAIIPFIPLYSLLQADALCWPAPLRFVAAAAQWQGQEFKTSSFWIQCWLMVLWFGHVGAQGYWFLQTVGIPTTGLLAARHNSHSTSATWVMRKEIACRTAAKTKAATVEPKGVSVWGPGFFPIISKKGKKHRNPFRSY